MIASAGEESAIRAEGFPITGRADAESEVGGVFGAGGTPMAVLIDARGRIAAPLAAGEDAFFGLVEQR